MNVVIIAIYLASIWETCHSSNNTRTLLLGPHPCWEGGG